MPLLPQFGLQWFAFPAESNELFELQRFAFQALAPVGSLVGECRTFGMISGEGSVSPTTVGKIRVIVLAGRLEVIG